MRVAGVQCDTCKKKALSENASHYQMPYDIFPVPASWFHAIRGNNGIGEEPRHFCSGKCLSEWALEQKTPLDEERLP